MAPTECGCRIQIRLYRISGCMSSVRTITCRETGGDDVVSSERKDTIRLRCKIPTFGFSFCYAWWGRNHFGFWALHWTWWNWRKAIKIVSSRVAQAQRTETILKLNASTSFAAPIFRIFRPCNYFIIHSRFFYRSDSIIIEVGDMWRAVPAPNHYTIYYIPKVWTEYFSDAHCDRRTVIEQPSSKLISQCIRSLCSQFYLWFSQ